MASDLSSVCTEANEILDDEKEEGEISLEDVSSSEDGPPYRYQPRLLGQCPHCLSIGHCATWCRSLTLNKKIFVRASQRKPLGKVQPYLQAEVAYVITEDAGKENRRHHHHRHGHHQRATAAAVPPPGLHSQDLQPISSDSDLELVGLTKKKKMRKKKRRKKSPSLSLSPSPVDMAIKETIHRGPPRKHQSPVRRKPQQQQQQLHKSPPPRKLSPQRMKKLKKPLDGDSPLQSRGTVTKLLKKVKKLEPFSTRSKEKRSSLKDKLSNIIGGKKSDEEEIVTVQLKSKNKTAEVEKREVTKSQPVVVEEKKKQDSVVAEEKKKKEVTNEQKKEENDEDLRQVIQTTKPESTPQESPGVSQPTPQEPPPSAPPKEEKRPPLRSEDDEDLQLRVIALRSAVMKKHRTRIARAKKQQQLLQQKQQAAIDEPIPRIESPFTSSFNEDFPLLAEICSPSSPLGSNKEDIYCPEDMELDSDVELNKEISMVLNAAEEDLNNIIGGDSPYSPTDDPGSPKVMTDQPMDLSLYTPSKPTETTMHVPDNVRKNDSLDGSILESRPYSPSDATVYDPELPGVLGTNTSVPMPLQPPPLPPLGLMPMMPLNPMNLLGTFPIMPMGGFAPVNPMLTAPFIPFTPTTATPPTVVPPSNTVTQLIEEFETDLDGSPLVPIEPKDTPNWKFIGEPLYLPDMNKLPMSGLVPAPVLKSNKQLQRTSPTKKPSESLFRNAEMRPVAIEDENKTNGAMFKPIKLPAPAKKAVTTQSAAAFDASIEEPVDSQKQIWPELEQDLRELEELEEQENRRKQELEEKKKQEQREADELDKRKKQEQREAEEKRRREEKEEADRRKKRDREEADRRRRIRETPIRRLRKKSVTPAPRARTRNARTPSRARDIYRHKSSRSSRDSETRHKSKQTEDDKEKLEENQLNIDDDEQALREILLASLAKRKPNAKRKAALEAAKRKAALEATKATSDKENIAEKPAETCSTVPEVDKLKETATLEKPTIVNMPQMVSPANTANNVVEPLANVSTVLMPAVLQQQQSPLKRPAPALLTSEQPPRKVVKKLNVIPASTRAVNNAIRYQNLLIQRKLFNQQKQALYKTRFVVNNGQRSESPQVILKPSVAPRFVISLNEDTESEPETDEQKKESATKNRPLLAIPTSDFEQSVDQFLKGMRLQQECLATTTSIAISKPVTPPIVAKPTSSVTSKTVTTTTTPVITAAAVVAKVAVTPIATVAKVAVTTSATIAVPKVVTTTAATSLPKERTVLNIPKPKTTANILSIPTTPQVVKHLPQSQQDEYRRLKQQIYQYEQLRLQKSKETATTTAITSQAQPTTANLVNTTSSLSTPSSSPTVLASSTPKASAAKAKLMPKTQLIATLSPMAKPSNVVTPVVVTPTKIINSTSNITTKTTVSTINSASKVTSSSVTESSNSKPIITSAAKIIQPDPSQLKLLSKITESLNSTKTLLNTAASKISSISSKSLKVLTMEQINQKTSQIQQKNNCVVMDDLNKTGENNVAVEKKEIVKEGKEPNKKVEKAGAAKEICKEASSDVAQPKDEDKPKSSDAAKSKDEDKPKSADVSKSKDEDKSKQTWDDFKQVVNNEVQTLSNLPTQEQKKLLTEAEEKLISKRHAVLDDITVMSGSLRQWEIERDATNVISAEIISLREQLRIAEEKLQGHKVKLQKIQPKVTLYHEKINTGRKECFRLSKICNGLGQQIVGSGYKVPTAGAELLNSKIKEVATHTQKLRSKVVSVQSKNAVKTGRLLKNNPKANINPNSSVEKLNKKQNNTVDNRVEESESFIKFSDADNEEITNNGACTAVSMIAKIRKSKYTFHKQNIKKPMDADSGNSLIKLASTKRLHGTNVNINRYKRINGKKFTKRRKISEKERQAKAASVAAINNATTSNKKTKNQRYFNSANKISDSDVGTNKEPESRTTNMNDDAASSKVEQSKTVEKIEKSNPMEIVEEGESTSKNQISSNKSEKSIMRENGESEIKINDIVNDNSKLQSIAIDAKSLNDASSEQCGVNTPSQILDVDRAVAETSEKETASSNSEKSSAVQVTQSADVTEKSIETDSQKQLEEASENMTETTVQSNVPSESENIVNEMHTSDPILNTTANEPPEKMEIENTNANTTDDTRTNEQPMNSGPTIVITDNVENDSVNNNTSSVVNTSLDDYMKEMTVSDEYDNTCSKDYKSSASVTSTEHSTTFDEEIRLLELASESDVSHEITSNCESHVAVEHETSDTCQSNAMAEQDDHQSEVKAQQETNDDCRLITKAERDIMNGQSSNMRIEHHATDNTASQSRQNTISMKAYRPYESILKLVRAPRNDKTDGILCPFALMGTCIDHECRYIHQPTSHCR